MRKHKIWLITLVLVFLVVLVGCKKKDPEKVLYENMMKLQYQDVLGYNEVYKKPFEYLTIEQLDDEWFLIRFYTRNKIVDYVYTKKYYLTTRGLKSNAKIYINNYVVTWRNRLHFSYTDFL